jgi:hypothetical protein
MSIEQNNNNKISRRAGGIAALSALAALALPASEAFANSEHVFFKNFFSSNIFKDFVVDYKKTGYDRLNLSNHEISTLTAKDAWFKGFVEKLGLSTKEKIQFKMVSYTDDNNFELNVIIAGTTVRTSVIGNNLLYKIKVNNGNIFTN